MIISSTQAVLGTDRDVHGNGWKSRRIVLASDGPDYSVHETTLDAGIALTFEYQHHRETVYVVSGKGTIVDRSTGRSAALDPGGLYSAGIGEPHEITTLTEMKLLCVFTPGLEGTEVAD